MTWAGWFIVTQARSKHQVFFSSQKMAQQNPKDAVGSNPKQVQAFLTSPIQNIFYGFPFPAAAILRERFGTGNHHRNRNERSGNSIPISISTDVGHVRCFCWLFFFAGEGMSTVCIKCRLRPKKKQSRCHIWIKRSKYFSNTLCYPAVSISTFDFQFC